MQKMIITRLFSHRNKLPKAVIRSVLLDQRIIARSNRTLPSFDPLKRLDHKDWLAPNEVIKIFKSLTDSESVMNVLERVSKRKDYAPNEALYTLVIQKLSQARKFDSIQYIMRKIKTENNCRLSDEFFYFVIKIYGNVAGHINRAIETLFAMPGYHCWPTVRTFNFVLNMLVSAKQFDIIHEVYLGAPRLGVEIDACCLNILIKGLCECDKFDVAFSMLDEFPKQGCKPNVRTYSTLMHYLCEHGRVDEAFELCERMKREGCDPDTITFNTLISGLCKQRRIDEGMELLHRMKLEGCYPNSGSYQAVLYGLLNSQKFVKAKCFMDHMISEGVFPSFQSYKLVIQGLCTNNLIEDVDMVLKHMVHQGFVPKMGMWKKILESMFSGKKSDCLVSYCQIVGN